MVRKKLITSVSLIITVVGILIMSYGIYVFMVGFHNIDLAFNAQYILAVLNSNYTIDDITDQYNIQGDVIPLKQLYIIGLNQIQRGLILCIVSAFILGLALGLFIADESKK